MAIEQVVTFPAIARRHRVVGRPSVRRHHLEVDVEIAGKLAGLLVALSLERVVIVHGHTGLHLDLPVDDNLVHVLAVETDGLPLIADGLHAASVELLQSSRHHDLDGRHGRQLRLVDTAKG